MITAGFPLHQPISFSLEERNKTPKIMRDEEKTWRQEMPRQPKWVSKQPQFFRNLKIKYIFMKIIPQNKATVIPLASFKEQNQKLHN